MIYHPTPVYQSVSILGRSVERLDSFLMERGKIAEAELMLSLVGDYTELGFGKRRRVR